MSEAIKPRMRRDLTSGSIPKHIATLATPAVAEMAIFSATELVHAYWMGRLGGTALAAVSMANTLRIVLISPMMGLSGGGMAVVARHIGAREGRRADHAVMQTLLLVVIFVLPLILIGQVMGATFLRWMGAKEVLLDESLAYLRIILAGLFFMECLPSMNGVIRGAGHPEQTLRIHLFSIATMLILEPVLVLGLGPVPALGVRGAALATVFSNMVGVAAQFVVLLRGSAGVRLHLADVRPDFKMMGRVVRIAMPTAVQRLSPNLANALLMRFIAYFGNDVLTAYSFVTRIYIFLQCLPFGIGNATSALVGQNLGARRPERAEKATLLAVAGSLASSVAMVSLVAIWPGQAVKLLNGSEAVQAISVVVVRYTMFATIFTACHMVFAAALAGAGDTISNMWIHIGALWLVQMPLAWILSRPLGLGAPGIWLGLVAGNLAILLAAFYRFKSGKWKTVAV